MFCDNVASRLIASEYASNSSDYNLLPQVVVNRTKYRLTCGLTEKVPDNSNKVYDL